MKTALAIAVFCVLLFIYTGCEQQTQPAYPQVVIDSLTNRIEQLKPGLGEYMLQVKYHHDALAKAIAGKDYERAAYEIDEIKEVAEKIEQLHITNDKLKQPFSVFYDKYLQAPLSVLTEAAAKKDAASLQTNFTALTANCNSCHHENNMAFMKIEP
jgi:hypothetical protein